MKEQLKYIEYIKKFAVCNKCHIWLGGSFLRGNATDFSDVDTSIYCDKSILPEFINGYGKPVFISFTSNPPGILIIIYEDGVAVDLDIIEKIDVTDDEYFHLEDIKKHEFTRNETVCKDLALRNDEAYQMSRLFHRSLIKYLAGKKEAGISVANEIVAFLDSDDSLKEENYKEKFALLLENYKNKYKMDTEYCNLLCDLVKQL